MRFHTTLLFTLVSYSALLVANQVSVEVIPENKAIKDNIEAYIGTFEDQDTPTLLRLQTVVKNKP